MTRHGVDVVDSHWWWWWWWCRSKNCGYGKTMNRGGIVCRGANPGSHDADHGMRESCQDIGRTNVSCCCYGCGIELQTKDPEGSGYVREETFEEKSRHRQRDHMLCLRCQGLSHGRMIPGVEDFAQKVVGFGDGKQLLTPQQLRAELGARIKTSRSLVVLLVDLLDCSGSMLSRSVRDLIGGNPIIAVGTKMDLLPKQHVSHGNGNQRGEDRLLDWFEEALLFKKLSVVSMHVVSSKTAAGISEVVADIKKQRLGRDVYIVGAANVGKSAFVRACVKDMASMTSKQFDPMAVKKSKRLPVESSMPGTTLSSIPLKVFQSGETLYDTPGLHMHHRLPHILTPEENKMLHPKRRLRACTPDGPNTTSSEYHTCYCWGALVRIHIVRCPENTSVTFYGPSDTLRVIPLDFSTKALTSLVQKSDQGEKKTAEYAMENEFGAASVSSRGGLRIAKKAVLNVNTARAEPIPSTGAIPVADIAISGIPGWVAVSCPSDVRMNHQIHVVIEAPVGIEAFIRPPMPLL